MSFNKEVIIITEVGPAAAGKGTQARLLRRYLGEDEIIHRESGGAIRGALKGEPEFAHFAPLLEPHKPAMARGELLPDEIVHQMMSERLTADLLGQYSGAIVDGIPRNLAQLAMYDEWLHSLRARGLSITEIPIFFAAPPQIPLARAAQRAARALAEGSKPRDDDKPETVRERWRVYKEETYPMIKRLRDQDRLVVVRTNRDLEVVHQRVIDVVTPIIDSHPLVRRVSV